MSALYSTTTDDLDYLLALGLPLSVVAERMGRSVDAVRQMIDTRDRTPIREG